MTDTLAYTLDRATEAQLTAHFQALALPGVEPLPYARKLIANASRFEAWDGDRLAGLVAVYCNRPPVAHITHVGVLPAFHRRGVAGLLLRDALALAAREGCGEARLEVREDNAAARALYAKFRFQETGDRTLSLRIDTGA